MINPRPVSIVTVAYDTLFFIRLLVEKVREFTTDREYEIIVVDRGSTDGSLEWLALQSDVRVVSVPQIGVAHMHGEAGEEGVRYAKHEVIAFLDSDAHPIGHDWLLGTADQLDDHTRLAGACTAPNHVGNPYNWYVHPLFMVFYKCDIGTRVILRKVRGETTDTGEEATIRMLDEGLGVLPLPLHCCPTLASDHPYSMFRFAHPHYPTIGGGVFHAWYGTRIQKEEGVVIRESDGLVSYSSYQKDLLVALRSLYGLGY